jgi:hypothetical protein
MVPHDVVPSCGPNLLEAPPPDAFSMCAIATHNSPCAPWQDTTTLSVDIPSPEQSLNSIPS